MGSLHHRFRFLGRLVATAVLLCFVGSLSAPALRAAEKATYQGASTGAGDAGDTGDGGGSTPGTGGDTGSGSTGDGAAADTGDGGALFEDRPRDSGDQLFGRVPRNDTLQRDRTLVSLLGGLALGLVGFVATGGLFGFVLAGALGTGLGYLISRELFPDRSRDNRYLSDPYYERSYGPGTHLDARPRFGFSTDPDTPLRDLEAAYHEALEDYRRALRSGDAYGDNSYRDAYRSAYDAYIRARASSR